MFCLIIRKKMAMVVLLFLVVLTVAAVAYAQRQEDKFPIIAYGGLKAEYFPQIMDCNFNAAFMWSDFDENDFSVADTMGLHLITSIHRDATCGQISEYESDFNNENPHFSHSNVIGGQIDDVLALNGWAWVAQVPVDIAGWMQRGLLDDYNNEQEIPTYRYRSGSLRYYAHFRMRLAPDAVDPSAPIAKIDAVRIYNENDTLVAEDSLWYSDFDTAGELGQYADFTISFKRAVADSGVMDYRVYWYGNLDLWVDRVVLEDKKYRTFMAGGYDDSIRSKIDAFDDYDNALFRWYLEDEPREDQFPANAYMRVYLDDSISTVPGVQAFGGKPRENPDLFQGYLDVVNPNELTFEWYPIAATSDTATDVDSNSLQKCWRGSVPQIKRAKEIAKDNGKPFWYYPQAFESLDSSSGNWQQGNQRYPTNNELKCNVWLGLCCGAEGLFYYRYASWPGGPGGKSGPSDTLYPLLEGQITFASKHIDWIGGLVKMEVEGAETTWVKVETYPGDTLWNAVRDMNAVVDSLGDLLLSLTWLDEGRWDEVSELSEGYITSITSDRYPQDSVWVEVGFFHDDLYDYFMLVNRRCLSTETQTVTVQISRSGPHIVKDMYTGLDTSLACNNDSLVFITTLDPGQGRLFKLSPDRSKPTHLMLVEGSSHFVSLQWREKPCADFYEIAYHSPSAPGDTVESASNSKKITGLKCETQYHFQVRAVYEGWKSNWSDILTFTTCTCEPTPGCPVLCVCDQGEYMTENNILFPSEISEDSGKCITEYYHLQQPLNAEEGIYHLRVSEVGRDHSYLDRLKLLEACHPPGEKIAVSSSGRIVAYEKLISPISARDENGDEHLKEITLKDRLSFGGLEGERLVLDFGRFEPQDTVYLVIGGQLNRDGSNSKSLPDKYPVISVAGAGKGEGEYVVSYRQNYYVELLELPKSLFTGREPKLTLHWQLPYNLDFAGLVDEKERILTVETRYTKLAKAVHSTQGDVLNLLQTSDGGYAELVSQEEIDLYFTPVSQTEGCERDFVLVSTGYYVEDSKSKSAERSSNEGIPTVFSLQPNYPNPFNPVTEIKYTLPEDCWVKLEIYNILGRKVATLVDGNQRAGYKTARWDAGSLSSGIYFYRLQAGDFVQTRKMVLLK